MAALTSQQRVGLGAPLSNRLSGVARIGFFVFDDSREIDTLKNAVIVAGTEAGPQGQLLLDRSHEVSGAAAANAPDVGFYFGHTTRLWPTARAI